jgi:ribosome recycling factor
MYHVFNKAAGSSSKTLISVKNSVSTIRTGKGLFEIFENIFIENYIKIISNL